MGGSGGIKIVPGSAAGTIRLVAVPDLVDVRAEGHHSEAVFDAPDADREVSGKNRGRCAREPRSGRTPCPFGKLLASLRVAPRPAERRCGSALLGRGRERPPYSACLIRHGDGWDVQGNPTVAWGRSRPSIPCGKTNVGSSTEMPTMDTDAVLATTCKDRTA